MTTTDPDTVPAAPVYTITVTSTGQAIIDGEPIPTATTTPDAARIAALAEITIKAALHGRPVRVLAKEADGSVWPLIVAVNGSVTTLSTPHPTPAPPAAPAPAQATPQRARYIPPAPTQAPTPASPREQQQPQPAPLAAPEPDWTRPPPAEPYAAAIRDHHAERAAGDYPAALASAERLASQLAEQFGPHHPHTVNMLTGWAWLGTQAWGSRSESIELYDLTELLLRTAQRRQEASAPHAETAQCVSNAYTAWRQLGLQDPESARDLSNALLGVLETAKNEELSKGVIQWIETGGLPNGTT
ncbi:hypothetical protein QMK19_34005 [Streptomyces sp. H10-C2]|uniref:hypothetical protein n=1 Tax=unclassified Streptomyces TaxID=2593676 RepID=UPI0024B9CE6F|nr:MULTISPECIES: hypothetical protein [unclassified Streptomyces]MDJ0345563.1 hypothetical protein [Streptomyces sp. PH10-H1]MDJ0374509.1 hypothetical protein [Streptomyces sp. H10-C2]